MRQADESQAPRPASQFGGDASPLQERLQFVDPTAELRGPLWPQPISRVETGGSRYLVNSCLERRAGFVKDGVLVHQDDQRFQQRVSIQRLGELGVVPWIMLGLADEDSDDPVDFPFCE